MAREALFVTTKEVISGERSFDYVIPEGLTFDDVLLVPGKSDVLPAQADTRTFLSRRIAINIPIVAAAMDTVTDARLAGFSCLWGY